MAQFSRTWWGKQFIAALETFTDPGRLARGRSYARGSKVKSFTIKEGLVTAKVRGSVNPYFGVYKEPTYTTTIQFEPISPTIWSAAITLIASRASLISRLLLNEIPDNINESFYTLGVSLLPDSHKAFFKTRCSCPDSSNPCKHIAGVHYLLAAALDQDPFLLFELRGLSRENLKTELAKSPLGQALVAELQSQQKAPTAVNSYYTRLDRNPINSDSTNNNSLKEFWQGHKRLPQTLEGAEPSTVSAVLIKKQGDFPPFWHRDNSFIGAMEELYERVKTKNKGLL